jgi:hypothetical protein
MPYVAGGGPQADAGSPEVLDVFHSGNVYANFVPIALWQDPQGTEAAILSAISLPSYVKETVSSEHTEGDADSPEDVIAEQNKLIANGTLDAAAIAAGRNATSSRDDTTGPSNVPAETAGSVQLSSDVDNILLYDSPLTGIKYYVKTVTKQPNVIFPYDVASLAQPNGTTVQAVCDNLRLLIINSFDKIKKQYPDAFMTCSFRKRGVGSPTSQHPLGMACDIQFSKASIPDYFTRAQWVKDNTVYDQFLLEYKNTPRKTAWLHLSFNKANNRRQVCTFMNDLNVKGPGVTGLYDLSGSL